MFIIPEFNPQNDDNSSANNSNSTVITYKGRIKSLQDALLVLEATRLDLLPTINRRLTSPERSKYIQDQTIFVWNETKCGMKRWTDGKYWSASKVYHSHFLIYKQLTKVGQTKQVDYDGLIKQSFSLATKEGDKLHLISYYKNPSTKKGKQLSSAYESDESIEEEDDNSGGPLPSEDPKLRDLVLSSLIYPQNLLNDLPETKQKSTSPTPLMTPVSIPSSTALPFPSRGPKENQHESNQHSMEPPYKKQSLGLPPIPHTLTKTQRASYNHNDTYALNVLDKVFSS